MPKPKIAMIGAGSLIFCKTLTMDILATPALQDSEICLMNRTKPKLDKMEAFVKGVVKENKLPAKVTATLDRRKALDGADYVIVMIQVGGVDAFRMDYEIPLQVRRGPVHRRLPRARRRLPRPAHDPGAGRHCAGHEGAVPRRAAAELRQPDGGQLLGPGTAGERAVHRPLPRRADDARPDQPVRGRAQGPDRLPLRRHQPHGVVPRLRDKRDGRDLYPILRKNIEKPEYYVNEKVRGEVMRHFGYFMTESTGHLSEYVPWFRSSQRALDLYCDQPGFGGASGAYYNYCNMLAEKYKTVDYLATESTKIERRSVEYCSYILEAAETGNIFRLNGNVRNDGYITNLPQGCCVEVPVFVDARGLHPVRIGDLPPQCAALNQSNVTVQQLAVEAALTGDPEYAMQAIALDPLTSAVCTLKEVREMTREMLEAERQWLPQFEGKKLPAKPLVEISAGVKAVDVPLDPALAIANRFQELAK